MLQIEIKKQLTWLSNLVDFVQSNKFSDYLKVFCYHCIVYRNYIYERGIMKQNNKQKGLECL